MSPGASAEAPPLPSSVEMLGLRTTERPCAWALLMPCVRLASLSVLARSLMTVLALAVEVQIRGVISMELAPLAAIIRIACKAAALETWPFHSDRAPKPWY